MTKTSIEWTDHTINPFVGCSKCSPGCQHCYAERFAARLAKNPKTQAKYAGVVDKNCHWTGRMSRLDLSCFDKLPKKPSRVFVGSMTDIFHENTSSNRIDDIFLKIAQFPQHTFLFLTKRPKIMADYFPNKECEDWLTWGMTVEDQQHLSWPQKNVWLGVTVCNQKEADEKIPVLLKIPAAKRFVSVEPMLGPIDLGFCVFDRRKEIRHLVNGPACLNEEQADSMVAPVVDWIICGGETGPGARPIYPDWVKSLRNQCNNAEVPFFFKSWGDWWPCTQMPEYIDVTKYPVGDIGDDGIFIPPPALEVPLRNGVSCEQVFRAGKKLSGYLIDGREYRQFPKEK